MEALQRRQRILEKFKLIDKLLAEGEDDETTQPNLQNAESHVSAVVPQIENTRANLPVTFLTILNETGFATDFYQGLPSSTIITRNYVIFPPDQFPNDASEPEVILGNALETQEVVQVHQNEIHVENNEPIYPVPNEIASNQIQNVQNELKIAKVTKSPLKTCEIIPKIGKRKQDIPCEICSGRFQPGAGIANHKKACEKR